MIVREKFKFNRKTKAKKKEEKIKDQSIKPKTFKIENLNKHIQKISETPVFTPTVFKN